MNNYINNNGNKLTQIICIIFFGDGLMVDSRASLVEKYTEWTGMKKEHANCIFVQYIIE